MEFEYFLATELGMSVARLRAEVDGDEFVHWAMYYARIAQKREMQESSRKG